MVIHKPSGPPRPLNSSLVVDPQKGATGPLRHSWRTVMTKDTNGSDPELIVLGRDEAGKPQAARFPAGHHGLVANAAKAMGLTVCTAESADVAVVGQETTDWPVVLDRPRLCASGRTKPLRQACRAIEARRSAGPRRGRAVGGW